jgi:hypothetical protein
MTISAGGSWFTEDVLSGVQAAGTLLADTGAVAGDGNRAPSVIVTCNQILVTALQHRNAANTSTLFEWHVGGDTGTVSLSLAKSVYLTTGERLRLVTKTATTTGAALQGMLAI